jgi:hypothetical protein
MPPCTKPVGLRLAQQHVVHRMFVHDHPGWFVLHLHINDVDIGSQLDQHAGQGLAVAQHKAQDGRLARGQALVDIGLDVKTFGIVDLGQCNCFLVSLGSWAPFGDAAASVGLVGVVVTGLGCLLLLPTVSLLGWLKVLHSRPIGRNDGL